MDAPFLQGIFMASFGISVEPSECAALCKLHFSQLPLKWWYQADSQTVFPQNNALSAANGFSVQAKLKLPSGCPWGRHGAWYNVPNERIMHLEMRFIMDTGIMFGNNPFKVHSQACFKDLLAISSLVLVKCFYLYVDEGWLEQTRCR